MAYRELAENFHKSVPSVYTEHQQAAGLHWMQASFMVVAFVIGAGVLDLPYAFAQVGWIPATISLLCGAGSCVISGTTTQ